MLPCQMLVPSAYTVPDWSVFTGFAFLLLAAFILNMFRGKINGELRAVFNARLDRKLYDISNPEYSRYALLGNLYFFLTAGFIMRYINVQYVTGKDFMHPVWTGLFFAGALIIVFLVKIFLYRLTGFLARIDKAVRAYIFSFFMLHRFLAVVATPFLFLLLIAHPAWHSFLIIALGGLFFLWLVFLVVRLFVVFNRERVHFIFRIFFFMVIEILPLTLFIRFVYNLVNHYWLG